jgi:hypothetical protein
MKNYFSFVALLCALSSIQLSAQTQTVKETTSDVTIEAPPAAVTPAGQPGSTKPKRSKTSSAQPQTAPRHATGGGEVKNFSFNRTYAAERLSRPLIIRSGKVDPKTTAQLQEDLAIMSRILEKGAAEYRDEHEEVAGIPILVLSNGKAVRAMYLEDYGVLFTVTVNVPLQPEPRVEQVEEKTSPGNEDWNEARSELFGERRQVVTRLDKGPRREFDQHQFDEFRDSLVEALRNAANIRNLHDTDWVTLVVRGRGSAVETEGTLDLLVRNNAYGRWGAGAGENSMPMQVGAIEERTNEASTMVLRIRKNALDEFAKTKGSADEFRKKVAVALY